MTYSLIGFSLLLLATACVAMPAGKVEVSLTGKSWILNILNGESVPSETTIFLTFVDDSTVAGSAGCNDYNTTYTVIGNKISFNEAMAVTGKLCIEPIMALESSYLQALSAAATYELSDQTLTLFDASGKPLAEYSQQSHELGGSAWNFQRLDSQGDRAAVSGMVTNVDNAAIPASATATIQIQDTSRADAPATVIGEQIIENPGQFPIAYQVAYDPSVIIDNHTYTMSARITAADGRLLFINDTAIPVITRDNPTAKVEIPVIQTGG